MSAQKETPESLRREADGTTGVRCDGESVALPGWARKRRGASLVRFRGEYLTPAGVEAQAREEAAQARSDRGAGGEPPAVTLGNLAEVVSVESAIQPQTSTPHPAERFWRKHQEAWEARIAEDGAGLGESGRGGDDSGAVPLPCRSLETTQYRTPENAPPAGLIGPRKKVALALSWNVASMCKKWGIERVGFLTLTFADHVLDAKEAQRRFNSLATNVLRKRYPAHIAVLERQKSGRIHYHLLVVLPDDIRTGIDFDAIASGDYKTANKALRLEWAFWRKTSPVYGFGRTELLPIKSDADAMGQYVGKYIAKGHACRTEADKGVRLVRYSGGARMATCKFSELTQGPTEWRAKVCTFVRQMSAAYPHRRIEDMDDLAFHFGKRWAYLWRDYIFRLPPADLSIPF